MLQALKGEKHSARFSTFCCSWSDLLQYFLDGTHVALLGRQKWEPGTVEHAHSTINAKFLRKAGHFLEKNIEKTCRCWVRVPLWQTWISSCFPTSSYLQTRHAGTTGGTQSH